MKTSYKIRTSLIVSSLILMGSVAVSCNKETTTSEDEIYVTSSTVAINSFKLNANKNVAPSLDSVFFSIDLNNAVIFNADSLPKGADVSKLVPVITFASSMSKAEIAVLGEQGDTIKKVNYLTTTTDSIDFSKKVVLNVTSYDGLNSLEYRLKVNVHQLDPDSIGWEKLEVAQIPSRLDTPADSKCVVQGGVPVSLVKEADGSFTLSKATDIFSNEWTSSEISLPFTPVMESLTASDSSFYILSDDDTLYSSPDGSSWTALASGWKSIIGIYGDDTVLGIKEIDSEWHHASFSDGTENVQGLIPGDFPVSGRSPFVLIENKWAEEPTGFFVGGVLRNGTLSNATWGYDGESWATLSATTPPMENPSLVHYTMYRNTGSASKIRDFDAWLLIGGVLTDGTVNRATLVSYDNGVTWQHTNSAMNLPEEFPSISGFNAFTADLTLNADMAENWQNVVRSLTRASYDIDGTVISWQCPYIFLYGGKLPDGSLSTELWRGVLMRLNFTPII